MNERCTRVCARNVRMAVTVRAGFGLEGLMHADGRESELVAGQPFTAKHTVVVNN